MEWNRTDLDAFVREIWSIRLLPWQLDDLFKFVNGGLYSYSIPTDTGKAVLDNEPILSTDRIKFHGDLQLGDWVFGPDGWPTPVLGVTAPVLCDREVFFSDGTSVKCHAKHEWTVFHRPLRASMTLETQELANRKLLSLSGNGSGRMYDRPSYQLDRASTLRFPELDLPVDPYALGVWLGNGQAEGAVISGTLDDVDHETARIPYERGSRWVHSSTGVVYQSFRGLQAQLKKAQVFDNKHIPEVYFFSSEGQRRALLAGLMDTDGCVQKDGQAVYTGINELLVRGVARLAKTLGYRSTVHWIKPGEDHWLGERMVGRPGMWGAQWLADDNEQQASLPRKAQNRKFSFRRRVGIVGVEPCSPETGRCIQVGRADGQYLVGESLHPTHNSMLLEMTAAARLVVNPNRRIIVVKINDSAAREVTAEVARRMHQVGQLKEHGAPMYPGTSPLLRWSKGREGIDPWGVGNGFDVEGRDYTERNVNMSFKGYALGSRDLQGKRGDTLIDDIERQEEADSLAYRRQLRVRVDAVLRTLESKLDSLWMIVGTPFHADSIYSYVTRSLEGVGRPFEHIHRPYRNPDGTYLWPERAEKAEIHRRTMSKTAFAAAYELIPLRSRSMTSAEIEEKIRDKNLPYISNQKQLWDLLIERGRSHCPPWRTMSEWQMEIEQRLADGLGLYVGWDPATTGDWAVVVIACWGEETFLLRCTLGLGDTWEQLMVVRDYFTSFPEAKVMVENNGQQKAFKDLMQQDDILRFAFVIDHGTTKSRKDDSQVGLPAMVDRIQEGYFQTSWLDEDRAYREFKDFEEELMIYGPTSHPHILPAIWFGWRWHRLHVRMTGVQRKVAERELIRKTAQVQINMSKMPAAGATIAAPQSEFLRQKTREAWKRRA